MKISVIIPVYNGELYINKIYKCLCKQKYKNIEIIFFDDASSDKSLNILKQIKKKDERVKIFSTKTNFGPGGAKNEGLKHATGDYILFIDCDDLISKEYIYNLVENAKNNNYPDIVLSNFTAIDNKGNISYVRDYKTKQNAFYQKISSVGKLIKKDYIIKNNLELPYGKLLEDVLFHAYTTVTNPTYSFCKESGYYYVFNPKSISNTTLKRFNEGSLKNGTEYLLKIKNNNNINNPDLLCYYAFKYICWHLLKSGNKVGRKLMKTEYTEAFQFLEKNFSNYKKYRMLQFKHEKFILKVVLFTILTLKKLHLDGLFFQIYSIINLEKFWPKL